MKKTILSLSLMVAILAGFATPANAQSDLFLQGLKNPMVLNIRDLMNDEGVAIGNPCDSKYDKVKVYFDDFFGGITLAFHKKADGSSDIATLSASATLGSEGFKGEADICFSITTTFSATTISTKTATTKWCSLLAARMPESTKWQ